MRNTRRNYTIYTEYYGLNADQQRVPAIVLASRYGMTRGRIYQIVKQQRALAEAQNPRMKFYAEQTEEDAEKIASLLNDLLEG